jgi:hypothetical protein
MSKKTQRKFILACFFSLCGSIGFFLSRMDGSTYVAFTTLILGVYGAANVFDKKVQ